MTNDQTAKAASGALIIQSAGDTNVGFSSEEIRTVIETMADQLPKYAAVAAAIVEERLKTFEEKVVKRFEEIETADARAFADPDFQYLLGRSQHAYARSGDEPTADILIDLIAKRSLQTERNRLTLSLNEAVEKSPYLTRNEFAELGLCYVLRYTSDGRVSTFEELCQYLVKVADPFVPDISKSPSSYTYLLAQSCATLQISRISLITCLEHSYGGILTLGATRPAFEAVLGPKFESRYGHLVMKCIHDAEKLQVNAVSKTVLHEHLKLLGAEKMTEALWELNKSNLMDKETLIEKAKPYYPRLGLLFEAWDTSDMQRMTLTSVGMAIGFASVKRACVGFDADLKSWID